jgi:uncharacterized membrane protein
MIFAAIGLEHLINGPFIKVLNGLALFFEVSGLIVLALSGAIALFQWLKAALPGAWKGSDDPLQELRSSFSHQIVFALEFFIAGDIIRSIEAPTLQELAKLGAIVIIRTILHYSLS